MYFSYKRTKYFVDVPAEDYKKDPKPIALPDTSTFIKLSNWLGKSPQRVEEVVATEGAFLAQPCTFAMPGYILTPPRMWESLIQEIHKSRTVNFVTFVSFSRDALAHTDKGFREELVTKILIDEKHWGKVEVYKYKLIGIQMPDQLIVQFSVGLRKRI